MSLYSLLVTHMSLKVESEHRMEPPSQALYMEEGQVDTWTRWRRQREGRAEERGQGGEAGVEGSGETGRNQNQNTTLNLGRKIATSERNSWVAVASLRANTGYSNL